MDEILKHDHFNESSSTYFPVVLFIILYMVILPFESVDEILRQYVPSFLWFHQLIRIQTFKKIYYYCKYVFSGSVPTFFPMGSQPRSQSLSSSRPLQGGVKRRDPGNEVDEFLLFCVYPGYQWFSRGTTS